MENSVFVRIMNGARDLGDISPRSRIDIGVTHSSRINLAAFN